jgi:glucan phosphoethanolaminetransferase (alkaline phosphatase superfamily)
VIVLQTRTIARVLAICIVLIVCASSAMKVLAVVTGHDTMHGLVRFFDVDEENNLPTWYASATLLFSSFLLALIGAAERQQKRSWLGLSGIFLVLSLDEVGSFHEILTVPVQGLLGTSGVLHFAWVVPAAVFVAIVAMIYVRWFFALPGRTRMLAAGAGVLFVGGALGMEMVGALIASRGDGDTVLYMISTTVEETLEMTGVLVWIYTLLDYARAKGHQVTVSFSGVARVQRASGAR